MEEERVLKKIRRKQFLFLFFWFVFLLSMIYRESERVSVSEVDKGHVEETDNQRRKHHFQQPTFVNPFCVWFF